MSGLIVVDPPAGEPVSLIEARQHLRINDDDTSQDALIDRLIAGARAHAESVTRRALMSQTLKMTLDCFPGQSYDSDGYQQVICTWDGSTRSYATMGLRGNEIVLPLPPLQSVDSITYIDVNGDEQTLDTSDYQVSIAGDPARIVPAYGKTWPQTRPEMDAVRVQFVTGYADGQCPDDLMNWILLRVGAMFENREEIVVDYLKVSSLAFVDAMLDKYRVYLF